MQPIYKNLNVWRIYIQGDLKFGHLIIFQCNLDITTCEMGNQFIAKQSQETFAITIKTHYCNIMII